MTKEEILTSAATLMGNTGEKLAAQLQATYQKYKDFNSAWLYAGASTLILGPTMLPVAAAGYWMQKSSREKAVAELQAIRKMADSWMNGMRDKWLPGFEGDVSDMDPVLGGWVSDQVDEVARAYGPVQKLLSGIDLLPESIMTSAIFTFFGNLQADLTAMWNGLLHLLEALAALAREAGKWADFLAKMTAAAPYMVLGGAAVVTGYYLLKD